MDYAEVFVFGLYHFAKLVKLQYVAVFKTWNWWLNASKALLLDAEISVLIGSLCESGIARRAFVGPCSCIWILGNRVELIRDE